MNEITTSIVNGDCRTELQKLEAKSIQTCVTSPPYFGLRDYGVDGQIGLEPTVQEYVSEMVAVFREVKRVLKDDGTLWLNLGDSYSGSGKGGQSEEKRSKNFQPVYPKTGETARIAANTKFAGEKRTPTNFKPKDLIGIPWRVAFALQEDGWYLRQDIIWSKPNPMPESVADRCTKSHEYIFLLSKMPRYFYDHEAIKEPLKDASIARLMQDVENQQGSERAVGKTNGNMKAVARIGGNKFGDNADVHHRTASGKEWNPKQAGGGSKVSGHSGYFAADGSPLCGLTANKKSVWTVTTKGYKDAHFATFPEKLIEPCVLAGSREGDTVLDPFNGAGTTGLVAIKNKRNYIGIELNPDYVKLTEKRLKEIQVKLF